MSRASTIAVTALLVACLTASFFVLHLVQAIYPSSSMEDVLFISSPQFVKRASLGYSGLLANIYWMRAVQYFGTKHSRDSMQYKALGPLLDITTTLDPNLTIAYEFGSTFLEQPPPSGAGDTNAAIALIRKGIQSNPDDWHLYFTLGFIQYLGQHDYLAAAKTFEEGSKVPHANRLLKVLAAKMLTDAGSLSTARYMWRSVYEESSDKSLKENAELHLACLLVDEEVPQLEKVVAEYRRRSGNNPDSWRDLIAAGALRSVPRDPAGRPYVLTSEGRIVVADIKKLPCINAGKPA
jgi:hypothetical protein